jgi:two-component system invasion response regulator UvrY
MIRILLVDDHAVVRSGYRRLLDAEPGLSVVAEAGNAEMAYQCVLAGGVDVAVVDLSLGSDSGIELIKHMLARLPSLKVLVFSMHDSPGFATQAMRAGALGYLTKSSEPSEMIRAIHCLAQGQKVLSSDIAQALAREALEGDTLLNRLTPREFEVLRMAVCGGTPAGIAETLHLSQKTVLNNLSNVRQKLNVENDFKLLWLAVKHGLVHTPEFG